MACRSRWIKSLLTYLLTYIHTNRDIATRLTNKVFRIPEWGYQVCGKLFRWGWYPSNFRNIFTSSNTRVFGLPFGENRIIVGLLFVEINTTIWRTDRQTDSNVWIWRNLNSRTQIYGKRKLNSPPIYSIRCRYDAEVGDMVMANRRCERNQLLAVGIGWPLRESGPEQSPKLSDTDQLIWTEHWV